MSDTATLYGRISAPNALVGVIASPGFITGKIACPSPLVGVISTMPGQGGIDIGDDSSIMVLDYSALDIAQIQ